MPHKNSKNSDTSKEEYPIEAKKAPLTEVQIFKYLVKTHMIDNIHIVNETVDKRAVEGYRELENTGNLIVVLRMRPKKPKYFKPD